MISVFDIANWFRSKGALTHKKLQKLCYYAQAWYCALYDGAPLFYERVEAWVHGPVIPDLYREYAGFGWDDIPALEETPDLPVKVVAILDAVYNTYWRFSGDQLEQLTHHEDPWKVARADAKPWEPSTAEIRPEAMHAYYWAKYAEAQHD